MTTVSFLQPRLTGARFEDHAIPLEFLTDLAVLEEMIVEVAKWRFLEAHPTRKRTPRGFTDGISLKLTAIGEGSAVPGISLVIAGGLLFGQAQVYFEEARDTIVRAIGAADRGDAISSFPEKSLSYFDRFGRSLREGEAIEFTSPGHAAPARLTKESRRRLVLAASGVNEVMEDITMYGIIPEADQEKMTFNIQLPDGKRVSAPILKDHLATIVEAFNGYKSGMRIRLQGVGKFNRNERLLGISAIEHVSVLDPLDIAARLDELKYLKEGWLGGNGIALFGSGLDWLASAFAGYYSDEQPVPHFYPTAEGRVRAEWTSGPNELSLEIDLQSHSADWHDWNSDSDAEEARVVSLDSDNDWAWIVERIRELSGSSS
jgi:hypothetical protein